MTTISAKSDIVPVHMGFSLINENEDCPPDFNLLLEVFSIRPQTGNPYTLTICPEKAGTNHLGRVFYCAGEAELMKAATDLVKFVFGAPVPGYVDGPSNTQARLAGWELTVAQWPVFVTKWIRYRETCGMPYRELLQDPAMRWFSHPALLSVDAAYRQGRPTKRGFCEIDPGMAMAYLSAGDVKSLGETKELREWLIGDPENGSQVLESYLSSIADLVWTVYGT